MGKITKCVRVVCTCSEYVGACVKIGEKSRWKIGGVAPNALHICVGGSYVLPTVVGALCERLNA